MTVSSEFPSLVAADLERGIRIAGAYRATHPSCPAEVLAGVLYGEWYCAPTGQRQGLGSDWPPMAGMLRESHAATSHWAPATVLRVATAGVIAVRRNGGAPHALARGEYTRPAGSATLGLLPREGDEVVAIDRGGALVTDGWWRTWGGGWNVRSPEPNLSRLYFAPRFDTLPALINALTTVLVESGRPWMLKTGVDEDSLNRADAIVLYLQDAEHVLRDAVIEAAAPLVRPIPGPPLTSPVRPGIAWSEDPNDGRSFGENVCALVAEWLVVRGVGRQRSLSETFLSAGIDAAAPHLRAVVPTPARESRAS